MTPISVGLRMVRRGKGLTQVELAEEAGLPQSTISRIESGKTSGIDFSVLERLARVLHVRPGDLFEGRFPFVYRGQLYYIEDSTHGVVSIPEHGPPARWSNAEWCVFSANGQTECTFEAEPEDENDMERAVKRAKALLRKKER